MPSPPPSQRPLPDHTQDTAPVVAVFRFYEELNDFLAPPHRRRAFEARCARAATVKHMIEALGVPHTEVELVLVNGESVGFDRLIHGLRQPPAFEQADLAVAGTDETVMRVRYHAQQAGRLIAELYIGDLQRGG